MISPSRKTVTIEEIKKDLMYRVETNPQFANKIKNVILDSLNKTHVPNKPKKK